MLSSVRLLLPRFDLVCGGDSHFAGNGDVPNSAPSQLGNLTTSLRIINIAANGWRFEDVANSYDTLVKPHALSVTATPWLYWLDCGTNNATIGESGATMYTKAAAIIARVVADGGIPCVSCPWYWSASTADQRTALSDYRVAILANSSVRLTVDGYTLFSPNDHLDAAGNLQYANYILAKLRTIIPV